jgi:hypothetical protein
LWFKKQTPFLNIIKLKKKKEKRKPCLVPIFIYFFMFFKNSLGKARRKRTRINSKFIQTHGARGGAFFFILIFLLLGEGGRGLVGGVVGGLHGSLVALGAQRMGRGNPTHGPQDVAKKLVHLPP